MLTSYLTRPLLTPDELARVHSLVRSGFFAAPDFPRAQNNTEMVSGVEKYDVSKIVFDALARDTQFGDFVFPKQSTTIIVSRTLEGQGFRAHHDYATNGHYSTTVFLSDPTTYDGGALTLYLEGEEREFRLPAGNAITYHTGVPHCVTPVTRGERLAAVFWTTSLVADSRYRQILSDLRHVRSLLPSDFTYDLSQSVEDPAFLIQGVENKLIQLLL